MFGTSLGIVAIYLLADYIVGGAPLRGIPSWHAVTTYDTRPLNGCTKALTKATNSRSGSLGDVQVRFQPLSGSQALKLG